MGAPAELLKQGYAAFAKGDIAGASRLCDAALAHDPRDAKALHLAAAIAIRAGRLDAALARMDAAIAANAGDAHQYLTRGQVLRALGHPGEADLRKAIELDPRLLEAHASLGAALIDSDPAAARRHLEIALAGHPDAAEWRYNLALSEIRSARDEVALRHLEQVVKQRPAWADPLAALGGVHARNDRLDAAVHALEAALSLDPRHSPAWNNLGAVRLAQGRLDEARTCLKHVLGMSPGDANAWTNLGNVERRLGDRAAAERAFREATVHAPSAAAGWQNLGNTLREEGRIGEAVPCLEKAIGISGLADAHMSLAITLLMSGDLARAWNEYRWRLGDAPADGARELLDAAIAGGRPIELVGEQGLGDVLFFLRWAKALREHGAGPLGFRGDARLHGLLRSAGLFDVLRAEGEAPVEGAFSMFVGNLPALLGKDAPSHPRPLPLRADPAAVEAARDALAAFGPSPYVAVAWRAGTASVAGEERLVKHIPPEALGAALRGSGATVVSVQRAPGAGEIERLGQALRRAVFDASAWNEDIGRIAGMMAAVDAYVGVSSTNVHIAAGIGRRASILVSDPPEWRYGASGEGTPWFEGFRLYREHPVNGWDAAIAALAGDLGRGFP